MTYSQRRLFIRLMWAFVSNGFLPFIFGFVISLISATHVVTESFNALDKSGIGFCVKPVEQGGNYER